MLSGWVRLERQPPMSDLRPRRALRTAMHPLGCQIIQAWREEGWISAKLIHISSRQAISTITISVIWGSCMVLVEWRNTNIYAGAFKHKHHLSSSHLPTALYSQLQTLELLDVTKEARSEDSGWISLFHLSARLSRVFICDKGRRACKYSTAVLFYQINGRTLPQACMESCCIRGRTLLECSENE